jgi:hypothetical protein
MSSLAASIRSRLLCVAGAYGHETEGEGSPKPTDTFAHGVDEPGYATQVLRAAMAVEGMTEESIHVLPIGAQIGFFPRDRLGATEAAYR